MPIASLSPARSTTQVSSAVAWQCVQSEVSENIVAKRHSTLEKIPTLFLELKTLFGHFFNLNEAQSTTPRSAATELARIKAEVDKEFALIDKISAQIDQANADIEASKIEGKRLSQVNEESRAAYQAEMAVLEAEEELPISTLQDSDLLCKQGWLILEEMQRVMAELHDCIELEKAYLKDKNQEHTLTDPMQKILNGVEESFEEFNHFVASIIEVSNLYDKNNNTDTPICQPVVTQKGLYAIAVPLVAMPEIACTA